MATKNFKAGLDSLIQNSRENIENEKSTDKKKENGDYLKATYYFQNDRLADIKAIAYHDRKSIGEVLDEAIARYINQYEHIERARALYSEKKSRR
ncbi:MAG TPA: hypothetical protein VE912_00230 [Bacteroidales bacterium]|nr:hypothetical protein [Bacteroidales bacterium]